MVFLDRADAAQPHAAAGEKIPRRDLDHIDAAELADVAPAGHDRADLGGAALHQPRGHGGQKRARQAARQMHSTAANAVKARPGVAPVQKREQQRDQRADARNARELLLVFIGSAARAAGLPQSRAAGAWGG